MSSACTYSHSGPSDLIQTATAKRPAPSDWEERNNKLQLHMVLSPFFRPRLWGPLDSHIAWFICANHSPAGDWWNSALLTQMRKLRANKMYFEPSTATHESGKRRDIVRMSWRRWCECVMRWESEGEMHQRLNRTWRVMTSHSGLLWDHIDALHFSDSISLSAQMTHSCKHRCPERERKQNNSRNE